MKVLFAGYRHWSLELLRRIKNNHPDVIWISADSPENLSLLFEQKSFDLILLAGWSWILPKNMVESIDVLGLHPSDLPSFAGGSPIQNQILNGVNDTKMTLFRLNEKVDDGDILYKEPLSLLGHMEDIFENMIESSENIISRLVDDFPELVYQKQNKLPESENYRRVKPSQSRITLDDMANMNTLELYDFIRCREDPYPNVYIEDSFGKLYFKFVEHVK